MAELVLLLGNVAIHRFPLDKAETLIGRGSESDILIMDSTVSSRHAKIHCEFSDQGRIEKIVFEDLASTNGSRINNQLVKLQELLPNDIIGVGSTQLQLIHEEDGGSQTTFGDWDHLRLRKKLDEVNLDELSSREKEIFAQIGRGKQRKEIARELSLSVHTVSDHIKAIYRKLDISSKQEAVLLYRHLES